MLTYAHNFKDLKSGATFEAVCAHYNLALIGRGAQRTALCPFHNDTKPSLKINLEKKIFHCFGCEAKGNILDFVGRMEHEDRIAKAADVLAQICGIGTSGTSAAPVPSSHAEPVAVPPANEQCASEPETPLIINPPLTFRLKLDPNHSYLDERNVTPAQREAFGLGYCNRGMMQGRICIPIHNERGDLIAYAGRWPADEGWPEGEDRYKLPPKFQKTRVLFNLHRIVDVSHVVLVEGYWSVIRLHSLGIPVASPMGWSISPEQVALLRDRETRSVTLLADGDETGRRARERVLPMLAETFFVRSSPLPDGAKPDTLEEERLLDLVKL